MRSWAVLVALAVSTAAGAQQAATNAQAETGQPPQRVRSVVLQPGQNCPASTSSEVVVCYNGGNPYRIPPQFRREAIPPANQSWVNRATTVDQVSRVAGGLPDTCSPIGTGGQTGCFQQRAEAYAAEKRAQRRAEETVPGGSDGD